MTAAEAGQFAYLKWQRQTDPPYYVNSTAISDDGGYVVAGTFFHEYATPTEIPAVAPTGLPQQYGTYCFSSDGTQLWADKFEGYEGVYSVAISGDGSTAASGGWFSSSPSFEGFIRIYDVANGPANVIDFRPPERVNGLAISSDGSTVVAAADKVYLFQKANGLYPAQPAELDLQSSTAGATEQNSAQAVAVAADGSWVLVGDIAGNVYFVDNSSGSFGKPFIWSSSSISTVHSVAMNPDATWFAACGSGSEVFLFDRTSMTQDNPPNTAGTYTMDTGGRVGWVAINADGTLLSAIGNKGTAGAVVAIKNDNGTLTKAWEAPTNHNPNSTSVDAGGKFVTVADGYPDGKPGSFSLFNGATGDLEWSFPTTNMNWPMFISADATGICAGTDSGTVYYFTTPSD